MPTQPPRFRPRPQQPRKAWAKPTNNEDKRIRGRRGQQIRKAHLEAEPLCRLCRSQGLAVAADQVDHIVPLKEGGGDVPGNRQSLCKPCHRKKTADEAARGRARARLT